eukprot:scpid87140/ scgid14211/ 
MLSVFPGMMRSFSQDQHKGITLLNLAVTGARQAMSAALCITVKIAALRLCCHRKARTVFAICQYLHTFASQLRLQQSDGYTVVGPLEKDLALVLDDLLALCRPQSSNERLEQIRTLVITEQHTKLYLDFTCSVRRTQTLDFTDEQSDFVIDVHDNREGVQDSKKQQHLQATRLFLKKNKSVCV